MSDKPRTLADDINDAVADNETEEDEDALASAQPQPAAGVPVPIPNIVAEALRSAPDVLVARELAQIPPHMSVAELVDKPIVIAWKEPRKAYLPDDGSQRDGYFVTGAFTDTQQTFTTWIGQSALKRDLESLALPFRTIIRKTGRKYNFR